MTARKSILDVNPSCQFYVDPVAGSDSNAYGLTPGAGAWKTIQNAVNVVFGTLDVMGNNVTINLGKGNYFENVIIPGPQTGCGATSQSGGYILFQGAPGTTPDQVVLEAAVAGPATFEVWGARVGIRGFTIQNKFPGVDAVHITRSAYLYWGNMRFGPSGFAHLDVDTNSTIQCMNDYTVFGNSRYHITSTLNGAASIYAGVCTFAPGTVFSKSFVEASEGGVIQPQGKFSGRFTGVRYDAHNNGVIYTGQSAANLANYIPGSLPGVKYNGGVYA